MSVQRYVSNTDDSVFLIRNLPPVVAGAALARYSRSAGGFRAVLGEEFLDAEGNYDPDAGAAFYQRVLVGYGDDSVAELGAAHVGLEGISKLAAKALQDSRLGLSWIEQSTRYVRLDQQPWRYVTPPEVEADPALAARYQSGVDVLFSTYAALYECLVPAIRTALPPVQGNHPAAYRRAVHARALDAVRSLLPYATKTNMGALGLGRAWEGALVKCAASPLAEVRQLGVALYRELATQIEPFIARAATHHGAGAATRLVAQREASARLEGQIMQFTYVETPPPPVGVRLVVGPTNEEAMVQVCAAILYPASRHSYDTVVGEVAALAPHERSRIVREYLGERPNRWAKVGRALEVVDLTWEITADLGAWIDLQRHRVASGFPQAVSPHNGFVLSEDLHLPGITNHERSLYRDVLEASTLTYADLAETVGAEVAAYATPLGAKRRWLWKMNWREGYHVCELRSTAQAHPSYRAVAMGMAEVLRERYPDLASGLIIEAWGGGLERLAAEERTESKRAALNL